MLMLLGIFIIWITAVAVYYFSKWLETAEERRIIRLRREHFEPKD